MVQEPMTALSPCQLMRPGYQPKGMELRLAPLFNLYNRYMLVILRLAEERKYERLANDARELCRQFGEGILGQAVRLRTPFTSLSTTNGTAAGWIVVAPGVMQDFYQDILALEGLAEKNQGRPFWEARELREQFDNLINRAQ